MNVPCTAVRWLKGNRRDQRLGWIIDYRWLVITAGVDSSDLAKRGESLIRQSTNRYLTTVRIAFRAKQRRFDDFDGLLEESSVKPVQRAIVELSDEQDQPDLLPG